MFKMAALCLEVFFEEFELSGEEGQLYVSYPDGVNILIRLCYNETRASLKCPQ